MQKVNTVILVLKKGGDYHFPDVEILVHHLRDKYKGDAPLRILCLNDVFASKVNLCDATFIPMEYKWKGWWSKLNLFSPALAQYRPFLYMDLDTAIVDDFSNLFPEDEHDLICLRDFYKLDKLASGLMWIPRQNVKVDAIWKAWISNPEKHQVNYRGDQEFMRNIISKSDKYWQDIVGTVVSFKPKTGHLLELPKGVSVVCFHGQPRPRVAAGTVKWVKDYFLKRKDNE